MRPLALPALVLCALLSSSAIARADPSPTPDFLAQRDAFLAQRNTIVGTLTGWSALTIAGGALLIADPPWMPRVAATRPERRAFGAATLSFAVVNAVFAVVGLVNTASLRGSLGTPAALDHERRTGADFFAVNAGLDMLYITGGALLAQTSKPLLRGFGLGVIAQGGFLLGFDVTSAMTYRFGER